MVPPIATDAGVYQNADRSSVGSEADTGETIWFEEARGRVSVSEVEHR